MDSETRHMPPRSSTRIVCSIVGYSFSSGEAVCFVTLLNTGRAGAHATVPQALVRLQFDYSRWRSERARAPALPVIKFHLVTRTLIPCRINPRDPAVSLRRNRGHGGDGLQQDIRFRWCLFRANHERALAKHVVPVTCIDCDIRCRRQRITGAIVERFTINRNARDSFARRPAYVKRIA